MKTMRNEVIEKAMKINDFEVTDFGSTIDIVIVDFNGFDEDGEEIGADYNTEAVGDYLKWLSDIANEVVNDYYTTYKFEDFEVSVGYASYDI